MIKKNPTIGILGAGPGGLATAMLLSKRGFNVKIFEKNSIPGGRTSEIKLNNFRFDVGPTFFMMKYILDEIFEQSGFKSEEYLDFLKLSPMYKLIMPDNNSIFVYDEYKKMKAELKKVFPKEKNGLDLFLKKEKKRFESLMPILQNNNNNIFDVFNWQFLKSIPHFSIGQSIFDIMGNYFKNDLAKLSFTFQSKYLGMSPWQCPGAFGLVPYVEHAQGVYHIKGGLSEISRQMAKLAQHNNCEINYNCEIKEIVFENKKSIGVKTTNNEFIKLDDIIINADFGYAASKLFPKNFLKKYSPKKLSKKKLSCSIFMLYLGLKKQYHLNHNTIIFAKEYKKNVIDIFEGKLPDNDISFYVRDTSTTDPDLAPTGKTPLYVLVPVPNNTTNIDWQKEKSNFRQITLDALKNRLDLKDIEEQIEIEKIITPTEWENDYNVYKGAVFNLGHQLRQMLWFRPHNHFEEAENIFLTGGGTHPGSGLPTIFESGRIAARLICQKYKKEY